MVVVWESRRKPVRDLDALELALTVMDIAQALEGNTLEIHLLLELLLVRLHLLHLLDDLLEELGMSLEELHVSLQALDGLLLLANDLLEPSTLLKELEHQVAQQQRLLFLLFLYGCPSAVP